MVWCVLLLVGLAAAEPHYSSMQPQVWPFYLPLNGNNMVELDNVEEMQYLKDVPRVGRTGAVKSKQQQSASPGRAKTVLEKMSAFSASDFAFDILGSPTIPFDKRGSVARIMNVKTLSTLRDQGVAVTHAIFQPCTMGVPHYHPRGAELAYNVRGSNLTIGLLEENGGRTLILGDRKAGEVAFFPKGMIHFVLTGCDGAEVLMFFNHEDYGIVAPFSRAMSLPREVLEAALGQDSETVGDIIEDTPATIGAPIRACLKRCGLL